MAAAETFVIVGAGLAGGRAVETLRKEGFDGRIVLIGSEQHRPYNRPPLSKDYLRGEAKLEEVYEYDEDFAAANAIEQRFGSTVESIEVADSQLTLDTGERIGFDRLLLCTGSEPRRLPGADDSLTGVRYLRTIEDSDRLRTLIEQADRVVVVGAGWIGCEVAASARQLGREVSLVAPISVPLEEVLGPEVGAIYRDIHADHGVDLHLDTAVDGFVGSDGEVTGVHTSNGEVIAGDLVVVGIGVRPRVQLAERAGLTIDNGVVTDEHLATSAPGIYAAGDIASTWYPFYGAHIRVEHWQTARTQGVSAAKNMMGIPAPYDRIPYFYSDQYDTAMEYSGYVTKWDRVVFRGDVGDRKFVAFWLDQGRVVAGLAMNIWKSTKPVEALIRSRQAVDVDRLTDESVPLTDLVPAQN
ncbi:MAG TPA: FAD-dependent oxidoreductase [Actinomycetes bacterium]|nr:FAD-dependent oxidoreductase [Actinomycetes bacterium]